MASAVENIFDDSDSDSGDDFVGFSREEAQQHLDRLNAMELEIDLEEEEDEEESDNDNEQPGEPFINWNTDKSDKVWMSWLQCFVVPAVGEGKLF